MPGPLPAEYYLSWRDLPFLITMRCRPQRPALPPMPEVCGIINGKLAGGWIAAPILLKFISSSPSLYNSDPLFRQSIHLMNQGVYLPVYGLYLGSGGPSATEVCGLRKTAISMRESVLSRGTLDDVSDSVLALFWIFFIQLPFGQAK